MSIMNSADFYIYRLILRMFLLITDSIYSIVFGWGIEIWIEIWLPFWLVVAACGFSKNLSPIVNLIPDEGPWLKCCNSDKLSADCVREFNLFFHKIPQNTINTFHEDYLFSKN